MKFAYITQGKLYYCEEGAAPRHIESAFAQDVVNRALARQQKNSWKTGGTSSAAMMARQAMMEDVTGVALRVKITAVARGDSADQLVYAVSSDSVGGLFAYDLQTGKENRLFHKENLQLSDFSKNPGKDVIACSQRMQAGNATISVRQGNDVSPVTEGDSCDEAPCWMNEKQLVYQSAGVARNQAGIMMGLGPASVQKLDLSSGTVTPLVEDEKNDCLLPHVAANGDMLYIRRPYEPIFKRPYPVGKMLIDTMLFPFRLMRAFFDFLNVFSMTFSKKPLTTAGGPKLQGPNEKQLFLRGRFIDAEEELAKPPQDDDTHSLVPQSWQLVRRDNAGTETAICQGVLAFDIDKQGNIVYSTGAAVYVCDLQGANRKLFAREKFVETLVVLD